MKRSDFENEEYWNEDGFESSGISQKLKDLATTQHEIEFCKRGSFNPDITSVVDLLNEIKQYADELSTICTNTLQTLED